MLPNKGDRGWGLVLPDKRDEGVGGWCYPIKETRVLGVGVIE